MLETPVTTNIALRAEDLATLIATKTKNKTRNSLLTWGTLLALAWSGVQFLYTEGTLFPNSFEVTSMLKADLNPSTSDSSGTSTLQPSETVRLVTYEYSIKNLSRFPLEVNQVFFEVFEAEIQPDTEYFHIATNKAVEWKSIYRCGYRTSGAPEKMTLNSSEKEVNLDLVDEGPTGSILRDEVLEDRVCMLIRAKPQSWLKVTLHVKCNVGSDIVPAGCHRTDTCWIGLPANALETKTDSHVNATQM